MRKATMKTQTYTITELKDLNSDPGYRNALRWVSGQTGTTMEDEDTLAMEADEFRCLFTWNGKPAGHF